MEHECDTLPHWLTGSPQGEVGHASAAYNPAVTAQPAYPAWYAATRRSQPRG